MVDLALVSIDDMLDEVERRCKDAVIAVTQYEEGTDIGSPSVLTRISGSFTMCEGLVRVLKHRCEDHSKRLLGIYDDDDDEAV